jgi:hypothetical protein
MPRQQYNPLGWMHIDMRMTLQQKEAGTDQKLGVVLGHDQQEKLEHFLVEGSQKLNLDFREKYSQSATISTDSEDEANVSDTDTNLLSQAYSPKQGWVFQLSFYRHHP